MSSVSRREVGLTGELDQDFQVQVPTVYQAGEGDAEYGCNVTDLGNAGHWRMCTSPKG